mmetsp:Transcript_6683/g.29437  ORF Transcript_6683/g.29437 Transcript_6683/m.29437 type:complete len:427 (-) Transcript_6683:339-1619(-)
MGQLTSRCFIKLQHNVRAKSKSFGSALTRPLLGAAAGRGRRRVLVPRGHLPLLLALRGPHADGLSVGPERHLRSLGPRRVQQANLLEHLRGSLRRRRGGGGSLARRRGPAELLLTLRQSLAQLQHLGHLLPQLQPRRAHRAGRHHRRLHPELLNRSLDPPHAPRAARADSRGGHLASHRHDVHAARVHARGGPLVRTLRRGQGRPPLLVLRLRLFPHLVDVDGDARLIHPVGVERGGGPVAERPGLQPASLLDGLDLVEDGSLLPLERVGSLHLVAERELAIDLVPTVERILDDGVRRRLLGVIRAGLQELTRDGVVPVLHLLHRALLLPVPPVVHDEKPEVEPGEQVEEVIGLLARPVLIELEEVLVLLVVVHDHVDLLVVLGEGVVPADVAAVASRQQRAPRARLDPVLQREVVRPRAVLEGLP